MLPKSMHAWHSLKLRDSRGYDGEGDFVIADPARGFLIVEVKGGRISKEHGQWLQNGQPMKRSPREQALGFARTVAARLAQRGFKDVPFGSAVCFPDVDSAQGLSQGDLDGIVLAARELLVLDHALPALFDRAIPSRGDRPPNPAFVDVLHELWDETWVPRMSLAVRAKRDDAERIELDRAQLEVLDSWQDNQRLLVTGPAGSGKTLVAMEAARRSAREGARTLLLCFTEALALSLKRSLDGSGVTVAAIRRHAAQLLVERGATPIAEHDNAAWERAPLDAAALLEAEEPRFDAVIVDEAQDFDESDWMYVDALAQKGKLWAFRDPSQAFWANRKVDEQLFQARNRLTRCYRNPAALWQVARAYGGGQDLAPPPVREAVEQRVLCVVACPSEASVVQKVVAEVQRLRGEGFELRDIAIISLRGRRNTQLLSELKIPGVVVARADDERADELLVADTFLRFKGLERKAVIVVDLPKDLEQRDKRMHIALTRATATARVVAWRDAIEADSVLRAAG
jgi:hypothetical protein